MTGPRIYPDNTAVSRTPRPTKGLGDLLKKILYDNPKANIASLRDPVDPATIDEFLMQAAMGSVGSMDKVGGKVGEGLKKVLGVSGKEPLVQAAKEAETLIGVAMRNKKSGLVTAIDGFDGGHDAVWNRVKEADGLSDFSRGRAYDDGFVTSTGRYVDRAEALKLARERGQWTGMNRLKLEPSGERGLMSEAIKP